MKTQVSRNISRRGIVLSLAGIAVAAGLLWFGMLGGVGTASADGGLDGVTPLNGELQHQQPPINACLFPGIPC